MAGMHDKFRWRAGAGTVSLALLLAGCAGAGSDAPRPARPIPADGAGWQVPLGAASPEPAVKGLRVLVVGDSWARNIGVGLADADKASHNLIVNAGKPGCGVLQPARILRKGTMVAAPAQCNTWPERWHDLVNRYRPTAALLEVGYWDGGDSQQLPGQRTAGSITEPAFRRRFDAQMDRAISILSATGAKVYVPNVIDNDGPARANSDAMNAALRAAVRRNAQARLLDVHGQLCTKAKVCPQEVGGIQVYDQTRHLSGSAHDRIGAWILNSIYTDLHADRK